MVLYLYSFCVCRFFFNFLVRFWNLRFNFNAFFFPLNYPIDCIRRYLNLGTSTRSGSILLYLDTPPGQLVKRIFI
jgi:hypothetical protein